MTSIHFAVRKLEYARRRLNSPCVARNIAIALVDFFQGRTHFVANCDHVALINNNNLPQMLLQELRQHLFKSRPFPGKRCHLWG